MTHDVVVSPDLNTPPVGSGHIVPLIGAIALTLIWGSYTVWVSMEILSFASVAN